jgi:outer membrane receptor protein involved in Fe transport
MKKTIITLIYLTIFFYVNTNAQTAPAGKVTGRVLDEQKKPLDYVSIALLKAKDSTSVKGSLTAENGIYSFNNLPDGSYLVAFNMVGYAKVIKGPFAINATQKNYSLEDLVLKATAKQLNSVNIVSRKPLVEKQLDKTVLNIENSILATGNTALEILQKAPGVSVDKDGNISLRGKSGVNVMIDGKPTYLSSTQLADLLNATEGDAIQSIELITNPSSKYDASGNSGIINIKLKKSRSYGTNGSVLAGAGYGKYYKANTGLTLNHREKKFNVFGNINYARNKRYVYQTLDRINNTATDPQFFNQASSNEGIRNNTTYKAGLDYFIDDKNTIGAAVNGTVSKGTDQNNPTTLIGKVNGKADSLVKAFNPDNFNYKGTTFNLNYKGTLDTSGSEITADADYSTYNRFKNTAYNNYFFNADGTSSRAPSVFRNPTPSTIKIWTGKVDYTHPFSKKTKLDAGLKTSFVTTDNNSIFENYIGNTYQNDPAQSNHFIYTENVNAAYTNLRTEFKTTTVQVGLRAEQTNSKGNSITAQSVVNRHYLDLFPSLFVNQVLSKDNELGFSYSRRIDRPNYESLNPFIRFIDLYSYSIGNPFLNPQYTNSFEVSYAYKKTLNVSLGYSITNDAITDIVAQDTIKKTSFVTDKNIAKKTSYNLNISYPVTITKWWNTNNNVTVFYNKFNSPDIFGSPYNSGKLAYTINTTHTITINSTMSAEATGHYDSKLLDGTAINHQIYSADLGLSKSLDHKKFMVKFALNDVFNSLKYIGSGNLPSQPFTYTYKPEGRIFRLTGTYRFGSTEIKGARQRSKGSAEEESRIKS